MCQNSEYQYSPGHMPQAQAPYPTPDLQEKTPSETMTKINTRNVSYTPTPRHRPIIIAILAILCIPIFLYQLFPAYTQTADSLVDDLVSHLHRPNAGSNFCTKEVGTPACCAMFLDAAPCVDECRKTHVDRETLVLTEEYDECVDVCLSAYTETCSPEAQHT